MYTTYKNQWVLIVGYGSIGRRHFSNLKKLGVRDVRLLRVSNRRRSSLETPAGTRVYSALEEALSDSPSLVIVSNPSSMHVETASAALESGANVILEKPIDSSISSARKLIELESSVPSAACSMAYCFRYHPLYQELNGIVQSGRLGRIFHAHFRQAHYLPSWHPWEDYRVSYAARADLGGGVLRTLDHELDLMRWIVGYPKGVQAGVGQLSGLEINVEDTADLIFRFEGRLQAHVHVCFGRHGLSRGAWIAGEDASATVDLVRGDLRLDSKTGTEVVASVGKSFDLNTIYLEMLRDSLTSFESDSGQPAIPIQNGYDALRLATAAIRSAELRTEVAIEDAG